jgi:dienelactone hydrolase
VVLAHSIVKPRSGEPEKYMLFLHGILGTRANWRGVARRVVDAR